MINTPTSPDEVENVARTVATFEDSDEVTDRHRRIARASLDIAGAILEDIEAHVDGEPGTVWVLA